MYLFAGIMIPFVGTALGSAVVFFMRRGINQELERLLLGFASGVMIAASVWSLLIPAIDMAGDQGKIAWIPASLGFLGGMAFLLTLDRLLPAFALGKREAGESGGPVKKNSDACPCGDAA